MVRMNYGRRFSNRSTITKKCGYVPTPIPPFAVREGMKKRRQRGLVHADRVAGEDVHRADAKLKKF
jgi:predicted transcriptional regulator